MTARRADLLLGLSGAGVAIAFALAGGDPAAMVAGAIAGGALGASRTNPALAATLAAATFVVAAAGGVVPGDESFVAYALLGAHAFNAGRWNTVVGLGALVVSSVACALLAPAELGPIVVLIVPGGWVAGRALRERERVAAQLAERASELEAEREAHAALSVRYERARIASEMHDIVAHAISVMVVQASAGQRLAASDPELTRETFEAIETAAREAEDDMGRLVALLANETTSGPAPDLALVEELVAHAAGSGLDVKLRLEGDREGLPPALTHMTYRVVQEGLTNALRYATSPPVSILVRGTSEALIVEVENAPAKDAVVLAGSGTGNGLRGLRERIAELGGRISAGPTPSGGWYLVAIFPRHGDPVATAS